MLTRSCESGTGARGPADGWAETWGGGWPSHFVSEANEGFGGSSSLCVLNLFCSWLLALPTVPSPTAGIQETSDRGVMPGVLLEPQPQHSVATSQCWSLCGPLICAFVNLFVHSFIHSSDGLGRVLGARSCAVTGRGWTGVRSLLRLSAFPFRICLPFHLPRPLPSQKS